MLPDDPLEQMANNLLKSSMFISNEKMFWYKIHGTDDSLKVECDYPMVCWSLYFKYGKKAIKIWEFHRFSDETLDEVYPEGLESEKSQGQEAIKEGGIDIDPLESLSEFIIQTCKRTLSHILDNKVVDNEYWLQEFKD